MEISVHLVLGLLLDSKEPDARWAYMTTEDYNTLGSSNTMIVLPSLIKSLAVSSLLDPAL
jgi:hypothetical protein